MISERGGELTQDSSLIGAREILRSPQSNNPVANLIVESGLISNEDVACISSCCVENLRQEMHSLQAEYYADNFDRYSLVN